MSMGNVKINLVLDGLKCALFDAYKGQLGSAKGASKTPPEELMYLGANREVCLPEAAIESFLSASNTMSAPKRLLDNRTYKRVMAAITSFVSVRAADPLPDSPGLIPFLRNGKPIIFNGFGDGKPVTVTQMGGQKNIFQLASCARLKDGIPNPKIRPCLPLPWRLEIELTVVENDELDQDVLRRLFDLGGRAVGIGTWRPKNGQFALTSWTMKPIKA